MPYDSFVARSKGLEGNSNLCVLHHEALFHLAGRTLNLADPTTQVALTAWMLDAGIKVFVLDNLSTGSFTFLARLPGAFPLLF